MGNTYIHLLGYITPLNRSDTFTYISIYFPPIEKGTFDILKGALYVYKNEKCCLHGQWLVIKT